MLLESNFFYQLKGHSHKKVVMYTFPKWFRNFGHTKTILIQPLLFFFVYVLSKSNVVA